MLRQQGVEDLLSLAMQVAILARMQIVQLGNVEPWSQRVADKITLRGIKRVDSNQPIIHFMHGNGFCGLVYTPLLQGLTQNYDFFLLDAQGHGDSDAGDRFLGWNTMAAHCLEVLLEQRKRWNGRRVVAVAHSFGALMSLLMVDRRPDLFERMVLLDPVIFTPWMYTAAHLSHLVGLSKRNPLSRRTLKRRSEWPSREVAKESLRNRGIFRGWREEALDSFVAHALGEAPSGAVQLKCPPWLEAIIFRTAPTGIWPALRRLRVPTQIIYGTETYPFVQRAVLHAAKINPMIQAVSTPGDHCFMQQDPERTQKLTLEFLAR